MKTDGLAATDAECAEGRTAPRVSLADIEANIAAAIYTTGAEVAGKGGLATLMMPPSLAVLTIAIVVLQNGFTIIGKSAPASVENFDAELGRKLAYEDAVRQVWPLMGYALRERLHQASQQA
jgi:hypothetical protein